PTRRFRRWRGRAPGPGRPATADRRLGAGIGLPRLAGGPPRHRDRPEPPRWLLRPLPGTERPGLTHKRGRADSRASDAVEAVPGANALAGALPPQCLPRLTKRPRADLGGHLSEPPAAARHGPPGAVSQHAGVPRPHPGPRPGVPPRRRALLSIRRR